MLERHRNWALLVAVVAGAAAGCSDDDAGGVTGPDGARTYVQVERLGNPLVSEVTFPKRDHGFHNTTGPATDVNNGFRTKVADFVTGVAGRQASLATTLSTVLIPDMLIVQPTRAGSTAGWLTWALADGYGGRKLADDVVDAGLMAIFGPLLNPNNVSAGLTTDNVSANDKVFGTTFPYLAAPN
jgi:hypothetical protein